jgi:2'-5' RNA ligase
VDRSTLRLFFALWPAPQTRAALARLAEEVARETRGRAVAADNLHLTLAFLGERPVELVPRLHDVAVGVECSAFALLLDDVGCWRKAALAWLGADTPSAELLGLHRALLHGLAGAGVAVDERAYAPHVTLARRTSTMVRRRLAQPIAWDVDAFALVTSQLDRDGAHYRILATWSLRAAGR